MADRVGLAPNTLQCQKFSKLRSSLDDFTIRGAASRISTRRTLVLNERCLVVASLRRKAFGVPMSSECRFSWFGAMALPAYAHQDRQCSTVAELTRCLTEIGAIGGGCNPIQRLLRPPALLLAYDGEMASA